MSNGSGRERETVGQWVRRQQDELVRMLTEMIAIPSENRQPYGNELPLQRYLCDQLTRIGFAAQLYALSDVEGLERHPAYWPGRNYANRPNLHAERKGAGGGKSLLFSVHADVVPGIPGTLCPDPFAAVVKDGKVYGRGACDMKGGIAAILTALRYVHEHGIALRGDVAFESVVDEEAGGANGTLAARLRGHRADAAIIPEPTNLRVCSANLGGCTWEIRVTGKGGMSFGGEQTHNPIYAMSEIVRDIAAYERGIKQTKQVVNPTGGTQTPQVIVSSFRSGDFEPGMADGIPQLCSLEVWVECLPGETAAELEQEFIEGVVRAAADREEMAPFTVEWKQTTRFLPGTTANTPLTRLLMDRVPHRAALPHGEYVAPFACDSFMFHLYSDTPAVIFGPTGENAHAADEFVDIESVLDVTEAYIGTMLAWCGETVKL